MDVAVVDCHISELEDELAREAVSSPRQHAAYEGLPAFKDGERDYPAWVSHLATFDTAWDDPSQVVELAVRLRVYSNRRKRLVCNTREDLVQAGATDLGPVESLMQIESSAYALALSLWEYLARIEKQRQHDADKELAGAH